MSTSHKVNDLVKRWVQAQQEIEKLRSALNRAECELSNSRNDLGKTLAPEAAGPGETFNIWVNGETVGLPGDQLLTITVKGNHDYQVAWWKKEKKGS